MESYRDILLTESSAESGAQALPQILTITLNRPEKRNALGKTTLQELSTAFHYARDTSAIRAIVLTGSGKVFCAGGDLEALSKLPPKPSTPSLADLLTQMHSLGKPTIAMVNGHALAGGLGLMLACDTVIADQNAKFGTSEIKVGLWPMMISAELVRNVGRKRALDMMLTGRLLDAQQAMDIGLITQCVSADELEATTMKLARQLSGQSPQAMRMGLRSFYETQDLAYSDALTNLEKRLNELLSTADAKEGLAAFLEKRVPHWLG